MSNSNIYLPNWRCSTAFTPRCNPILAKDKEVIPMKRNQTIRVLHGFSRLSSHVSRDPNVHAFPIQATPSWDQYDSPKPRCSPAMAQQGPCVWRLVGGFNPSQKCWAIWHHDPRSCFKHVQCANQKGSRWSKAKANIFDVTKSLSI